VVKTNMAECSVIMTSRAVQAPAVGVLLVVHVRLTDGMSDGRTNGLMNCKNMRRMILMRASVAL
jgi:hypothetical protein